MRARLIGTHAGTHRSAAPATPPQEDVMSLVDRAKNIIMSPKTEWPVIDTEQTTVSELYSRYIVPLVLIGPVASFIGKVVFGVHIPFVGTIHPGIGSSIGTAVATFVLALISVYVLALIIDMLAPSFDGQRNQMQALKLAAYSSTAAWVGGIFGIIPVLSWLGILLGLWSLYLLYTGVPVLMKSPPEKSAIYTIVIIIAWIVLFFIIGAIVAALFGAGMYARGL